MFQDKEYYIEKMESETAEKEQYENYEMSN